MSCGPEYGSIAAVFIASISPGSERPTGSHPLHVSFDRSSFGPASLLQWVLRHEPWRIYEVPFATKRLMVDRRGPDRVSKVPLSKVNRPEMILCPCGKVRAEV